MIIKEKHLLKKEAVVKKTIYFLNVYKYRFPENEVLPPHMVNFDTKKTGLTSLITIFFIPPCHSLKRHYIEFHITIIEPLTHQMAPIEFLFNYKTD
jgi:hypothetical protein